MLNGDAILYYAEHPVEFTEDVILAKPEPGTGGDTPQRSRKSNDDRPQRPRRRKKRGGGLGGHLVYMYSPISKDTMHGTDAAPAI